MCNFRAVMEISCHFLKTGIFAHTMSFSFLHVGTSSTESTELLSSEASGIIIVAQTSLLNICCLNVNNIDLITETKSSWKTKVPSIVVCFMCGEGCVGSRVSRDFSNQRRQGPAPGPHLNGTCPKPLPREASTRHVEQML